MVATLTCEAQLELQHLPHYLDKIADRLQSFNADVARDERRVDFRFAFGGASFDMPPGRLVMRATAEDAEGLARIKDLLATAVQVYAKEENPNIVWSGDLSAETRLAQFREMTVRSVSDVTSHMRRIRFEGGDLARFGKFGGMHIRVLLPTRQVPQPRWPTLGRNGLAVWPPDEMRPASRVYTIRRLDIAEGWMDVDFVVHDGESVGSDWAVNAAPGQVVGIMGPVGRPVPVAQWYVMGADETGLPAISRMLESLPPATRGTAFVEVADEGEKQELVNNTAIEVKWIYRDGVPAGRDERLAEAVLSTPWPESADSFGWFAAEYAFAARVREHWCGTLGLGRNQTLAAAYWRIGSSGLMAG